MGIRKNKLTQDFEPWEPTLNSERIISRPCGFIFFPNGWKLRDVLSPLAFACLRNTMTIYLVLSCILFTTPAHAAISGLELDDLQQKLILAESSGDPRAIGDDGRARGLMQIQEATWRRYSTFPWRDALVADINISVGRMILEDIAGQYGKLATAAKVAYTYNTGRFCRGPLPHWTKHHPNKIYRDILNGK